MKKEGVHGQSTPPLNKKNLPGKSPKIYEGLRLHVLYCYCTKFPKLQASSRIFTQFQAGYTQAEHAQQDGSRNRSYNERITLTCSPDCLDVYSDS